MKVYVVTYQMVLKGDDTGITVHAYPNKEDAEETFNHWVAEEREACLKDGWRIDADTDTVFEAYEDGDWPMNHSCAYIDEFDL